MLSDHSVIITEKMDTITKNNKTHSDPYSHEKTLNESVVVNRPSSPRKFFERLYGHLESKDDHEKEFSLPNSPNSSNSVESCSMNVPDHEKRETAFAVYSNEVNTRNIGPFRSNQGFPAHFESLRDMIGLSGETPVFPPGLAAFRKCFYDYHHRQLSKNE